MKHETNMQRSHRSIYRCVCSGGSSLASVQLTNISCRERRHPRPNGHSERCMWVHVDMRVTQFLINACLTCKRPVGWRWIALILHAPCTGHFLFCWSQRRRGRIGKFKHHVRSMYSRVRVESENNQYFPLVRAPKILPNLHYHRAATHDSHNLPLRYHCLYFCAAYCLLTLVLIQR